MAETLWVIAGAVLLLALGDVVIALILALAAAAMATAWWIRRAGHRARSSEVSLASVSRLPTGHREPKRAPVRAPRHRHSAA
ncbi:hypothetical protein [Mycobacterium arosiense]|uniref:Uncharacterized protein n=1 Tax=Mycobacterium arosiense ATCC BAA-1401 = DSM 45069 TaxID=1265311 RepID=A0A1W9ZL09_MYCAI|nr:hypothetical protein [Mycobacterium arosiense]ORA17373.1 hypothetical protein BST14_08865 [Mycobacterium arosiense ATCC BAA-1401 = DSM 45069]